MRGKRFEIHEGRVPGNGGSHFFRNKALRLRSQQNPRSRGTIGWSIKMNSMLFACYVRVV